MLKAVYNNYNNKIFIYIINKIKPSYTLYLFIVPLEVVSKSGTHARSCYYAIITCCLLTAIKSHQHSPSFYSLGDKKTKNKVHEKTECVATVC